MIDIATPSPSGEEVRGQNSGVRGENPGAALRGSDSGVRGAGISSVRKDIRLIHVKTRVLPWLILDATSLMEAMVYPSRGTSCTCQSLSLPINPEGPHAAVQCQLRMLVALSHWRSEHWQAVHA